MSMKKGIREKLSADNLGFSEAMSYLCTIIGKKENL